MAFVERTDWVNSPKPPPKPGETPVRAADIKRWERGIAAAHEELEGRLSEEGIDERVRAVGDGTYAPVGAVGLDEAALAESISNPETASNSAVLGVVSSAFPAELINGIDFSGNVAAPRPAWPGSLTWKTTDPTAKPVFIADGDMIRRLTATVIAWTPAQIPNVVGWWDAQTISAADGSAVSSWNDLSGHGRHMVQATSGAQPVYRSAGINGHPAVQFDGTDDILAAAISGTSLVGSAWTVYLVGHDTRATATASKFFIDGFTTASLRLALSRSSTNTFVMQRGTAMASPPAADANPHRFKAVYNVASSSLTIDNGAPTNGTVGATSTEPFTRFTLGGRGDLANFLQGFIGSACIVQGTVSPADDAAMTTYLQGRWGVA